MFTKLTMKAEGKFHHTSDNFFFNLTTLESVYSRGWYQLWGGQYCYYSIRDYYRKYCTITDSEKSNPCHDFEILQQRLENPRQKERNSMN